MHKKTTLAAIAGALLFALPALADDPTPPAVPTAGQQCRVERTQMGADKFRAAYGTNAHRRNAFGKCVTKREDATEKNAAEAHSNASTTCRDEQAKDAAAFDTKYGTNKNKNNAFGKCVSQHARAETAETTKEDIAADVNAARECAAEGKPDPQAFLKKYGTNKNGRNAFGRCVSQKVKAQKEQESGTS